METLDALRSRFPHPGRIEWIGVRPRKRAQILEVAAALAQAGGGLLGDHYDAASGARGVTLIQFEHLAVVGCLLGEPPLAPARLRRNLVVSGINLLALKDQQFRVGEALLVGTGLCHPCARLEAALGPGGYNAMRGHGGLNARVLCGGWIRVGDPVQVA